MNNQIAIEDWGLYNNGHLACKWFNSTDTIEEIQDYFQGLRKKYNIFPCDDLELFIADQDTVIEYPYDEGADIEQVLDDFELMDDLDENSTKSVSFLLGTSICDNLSDAISAARDVINYGDITLDDLGWTLLEAYEEVPASLEYYIDAKGYANDLITSGDIYEWDGYYFAYYG